MKNVWIVNHSAIPPKYGGLNRHYYFSKYLSRMDYDVKIITASAIHNTDINIIGKHEKTLFREKKFGDVVYTYLKTSGYKGNGFSRIINFVQFPVRLLCHYKKLEKPDVIYASSPSPFAAAAAIRIAKKLKVPVILEVRDLWPETIIAYGRFSKINPVISLMYRMEKWMYKSADRLIFTFQGGTDYLRDKKWDGSIDTSKIYHINNGVDLKEYEENMSVVIDDEELDDLNTFKAVYTGSVRKAYRLGNLLDTAKIIKKTHPDIRFFIWGDGNEKEALVQRCNDEHIDNVSFKGRTERRKIPAVLSRANVNVLHVNPLGDEKLGRYGCSHNKLFDYLASGRPIVSNFKPKYDLIEKYDCGIVAKSTSPKDLAKAIISVNDMPKDEYQRLCENARNTAKEYDYKILAGRVHDIIEGVFDAQYRRKSKSLITRIDFFWITGYSICGRFHFMADAFVFLRYERRQNY